MSITFVGGINLTSATPRDGVTNENNNSAVICETTGPSIRIVDLASVIQTANYACLATPSGVSLINSSSAVVVSSAGATVDFIELSSGYRTNVSGGSATSAFTFKGQVVASDQSLQIAFAGSNTSRVLVKIDGNTRTVSTITPKILSNENIISVIFKSSGRWLIGTSRGYIYEINSDGEVMDSMSLQYISTDGKNPPTGNPSLAPVYNMSIDNNLLLAGTDQALYLIDWSTKTILNSYSPQSTTNNSPFLFCNSASGITIAGRPWGAQSCVLELDFTVQPFQVRDQLYLDFNSALAATGLNNTSAYGWTVDQNGRLRSFTIAPRSTTTRTVTVQDGGTNQQARLLILDDTGGLGSSQVLLDTFMQSPGSYRVPTGKTLVEIVRTGIGSVAKWDVSRYST